MISVYLFIKIVAYIGSEECEGVNSSCI